MLCSDQTMCCLGTNMSAGPSQSPVKGFFSISRRMWPWPSNTPARVASQPLHSFPSRDERPPPAAGGRTEILTEDHGFEILPADQHLSLLPLTNPPAYAHTNNDEQEQAQEDIVSRESKVWPHETAKEATGDQHREQLNQQVHLPSDQLTAILHCVRECAGFTDKKLQSIQEDMEHLLRYLHEIDVERKTAIRESSTGRTSRYDYQKYQEHIAQLQQENKDLRHKLQQRNHELKSAQQKIKRLEEANTKLKSSVLIKKGEVEGSFTSSDETPSAIASEYDKLFSRGRRDLVKATRLDDLRGKLLANLMFKRAYEECREAVVHEMFKELFCHCVSDTEQLSASRTKLRAHYGQLLHLKKPCIQANVDPRWLALKVVRDLHSDTEVSSSDLEHDPKYIFAQGAVKLALRMVTIQPPMVIDYPSKFNDDVHIKHSSQWRDEYQDRTDLVYFMPVLYSTCEPSLPIIKGLVGNTPLLGWR